jgi:hypothetical protein
MKLGKILVAAAVVAAVGGGGIVVAKKVMEPSSPDLTTVSNDQPLSKKDGQPKGKDLKFSLVHSSDALKKCLPKAKVNVTVKLRTDEIGKDVIVFDAAGLPAKTSFTAFFLEVPGAPFGAAEYFGDVDTDKYGKAHAEFQLIVEEAFASTIVDGKRVRVDLNHLGMWFADPKDDDICFGKNGGPVTPFDGDNEAGTQVFNSANALPGTPLP